MTTNKQLELGFNGMQTRIYGRRREQRVARAKWWFARMREAVESAWVEPPAAQAEQAWMPVAHRELSV